MTQDAATDDDGALDEGGDPEAPDEVQAVCDAVGELYTEAPGDILVFLPGKGKIRDTADALERMDLRGLEVLSLYGRLSSAEQHRIFEPHAGRRAVLSTNVAETSLTVPGIRYVVDLGTARISRYSRRTKVQRLPIEPVSQASANQRCGTLRPARSRHLRTALLRAGFHGAPPFHRAGDIADKFGVGGVADGGDRPRSDRGLPLRRPT